MLDTFWRSWRHRGPDFRSKEKPNWIIPPRVSSAIRILLDFATSLLYSILLLNWLDFGFPNPSTSHLAADIRRLGG